MKLHKNDRSNKSSILALKFCHLMLPALARGYTYVQNHEKIYVKSEFNAVLLKLTANDQIIAPCDAQNLTHWSYLPLPPRV